MLVGVVTALDLQVAEAFLGVRADALQLGRTINRVMARLKRSISLLIASSTGVLILPFSLYPRTCRLAWLVRRYRKANNLAFTR